MKKITLSFILTFFLVFSCDTINAQRALRKKPDAVAYNVDTTASPADDFFEWANGKWLRENPIPETESTWGIGRKSEIEVFQKILKICDKSSKRISRFGTIEQKVGDLWITGMDTVGIENQKYKPIERELKQINDIKDYWDLFKVIGQMHAYDMMPLFYCYVYQDRKQSNRHAFYIKQGGISLPEREYYFNQEPLYKSIREEYIKYIERILLSTGEEPAFALEKAKKILEIETFIADKHSRIENWRDPYKSYNKYYVKDLEKETPSINWQLIFEKMGLPIDSIIVTQPEFNKHLDYAIQKFRLDDWKYYLKYWFISDLAPFLHKEVRDAHFNFFERTIKGKKAPAPRAQLIVEQEQKCLGEALGQLFVDDFFSSKSKKRYSSMFEEIRLAFAEEITELDWMSDNTKAKSIEKLMGMKKKVGYPDKWKDFSTMLINRISFVKNILNANKWWFGYKMAKLTLEADRDEWGITPHEYNAYYRPPNNEVVIAASVVLIPGFTDKQIDDAVAYGYAGASTIGHEMTHGFDIGGRQYDVNGNLLQWWTPEDSIKFVEKTKPLIEQYNEYIVIDSLKCNGEATLDENIADLGGVVLALRAFKKTRQYKEGKLIAGYTPLQRFFMGYALAWMNQYTKESLIQKVLADEHAPPKMRINCVLENIPEFYEAFNVKPHNKMWRAPEKRVKIW